MTYFEIKIATMKAKVRIRKAESIKGQTREPGKKGDKSDW